MNSLLVKVYHLTAFVVLLGSFIYNQIQIRDEHGGGILSYKGFGGKFKYLTFWYFCIQTLYFGITVLNDFCGSNVRPSEKGQKISSMQKFRDYFLATLVFPVGVFVVMTFWGIYAVDRELVYPRALDKIIPPWLNHIMHTTIVPFLLIEKYIVYHQYPPRKSGLITLLGFALLYLVWILWIAYYANIWVYPILKVLQPHQRAVFIIVLLFLFISLYILGEAINKFFWGKERSVQSRKMKNTQKVK
ncbi:androgen-induced gene 1 protein-like isoform X1 [Mytilus trossulus]|uniref:androgen-induced gene 1 protein-like isoform X1 n=2 Tax=Mytilus trossulus TaxID=6551 RepID=UPI003006B306